MKAQNFLIEAIMPYNQNNTVYMYVLIMIRLKDKSVKG